MLDFIERVGVAKSNSLVDIGLLDYCVREELNRTAQRRIAVLDPVKVVIDNYPDGKTEYFELPNNPNDENAGTRKVPFTKNIFIDRDDVSADPPPKFFRMKPDGEVRLMGAYIVRCTEIVTDDDGRIVEVHCTADLQTGNGMPADGRKIKGTIHWLSADHCVTSSAALYDKLFTYANMNEIDSSEYDRYLNPDSKKLIGNIKLEGSMKDAAPGERFQFVRLGYFTKDSKNEDVYNRIVTLKDSFKL